MKLERFEGKNVIFLPQTQKTSTAYLLTHILQEFFFPCSKIDGVVVIGNKKITF